AEKSASERAAASAASKVWARASTGINEARPIASSLRGAADTRRACRKCRSGAREALRTRARGTGGAENLLHFRHRGGGGADAGAAMPVLGRDGLGAAGAKARNGLRRYARPRPRRPRRRGREGQK